MVEHAADRQFNWKNIQKEIRFTRSATRKHFQPKIDTLTKIASYQWRLAGIYTQNIFAKKRLGLRYDDNILLNNIILTHPYWTFSILTLIKNTMYGSSRPILRQFFESLIMAKGSEYDISITTKWSSRKEGRDRPNEISIERDVFQVIERKKKIPKELRATWTDLNDMTHPTRWSQQIPRLGTTKDEMIKGILDTSFIPNVHFTLDLLFMILCMYNHLLIAHYGRKAYRWYMGYTRDPLGVYIKEKTVKRRIKELIDSYYEINSVIPDANEWIKKRISEYRQNCESKDQKVPI